MGNKHPSTIGPLLYITERGRVLEHLELVLLYVNTGRQKAVGYMI